MADFRHWRLDRDLDGPDWLTLDRADASTNTLSAAVMQELRAILGRLDG